MAHISFSKAIKKAVVLGALKWGEVWKSLSIFNLEMILLGGEVVVLKRTLWCIKLSSGLKINLDNGHGLL